ncbi:hypothetical protein VPNG_05109 [Cytospora leucostoma]|uniref:Uncharacterized protein n=1 Tax=Cytospora leucostoma TaxID=1230097 RepID=A0A423X503_9PEZI|nr:hypothetical protein VPNG_05109 [Cytospora leucostoma]
MWDMMLYPGVPHTSRRHRRGRHSKKGRKCRACREHLGKVTVGGKKVEMAYCERHYCQKFLADGTASGSDDMPCMKYVKDADPEKFRYCSDRTGSLLCERHTCEWPTCTAEVEGKGERGDPSRSCDRHRRCARDGCGAPCSRRDTDAGPVVLLRWCGLHCCRAEGCTEGRAVDNEMYCERHVCLEPLCGGGKKRVTGVTGLGTGAGAGVGGRFCADHQCKADGCLERRDQRVRGSEHCALHICWVEGCSRPASAAAAGSGNRCDVHRECREVGCREYVYVERGPGEEVKYPTCEKHHKPQCPAQTPTGTQCDKRLDANQRYCRDHSCELSSCGDQRRPDSLQYCPAHKCSVPACQQLRRNTIAGLDQLLSSSSFPSGGGFPLGGRAAAASLLFGGCGGGGGGGAVGVLDLNSSFSSYCAAHACRGDGGRCGEGAVEGALFCGKHGCSRKGCVREVTAAGLSRRRGGGGGGLCDRHHRKRKEFGLGGACGGVPPPMGSLGGPMGMPMPMPMPMGFLPPFFGGPFFDSSGSGTVDQAGVRARHGHDGVDHVQPALAVEDGHQEAYGGGADLARDHDGRGRGGVGDAGGEAELAHGAAGVEHGPYAAECHCRCGAVALSVSNSWGLFSTLEMRGTDGREVTYMTAGIWRRENCSNMMMDRGATLRWGDG